MILVGRVTRTQETADGRLQAEFRCTNREVFNFFVPPAIRPPEDELIRCMTHRPEDKDGRMCLDNVLNHWEKL
jgi:hypothetical protein